jgi:tetratricopeptide (TPR) repeat protein
MNLSQHSHDAEARRPAQMLLVQCLIMDRKRQEALATINEMQAADGWSRNDLAYMVEYKSFCYKLTDATRAESLLTELIDKYGDTDVAPDAYFHRAVLRANRGAYEEAMSDIKVVNVVHLAGYAMANLCFVQGQYARAAEEYEQVLTSLPPGYNGSYCEIVDAAGKLVECYGKTGEKEKSSAAFKTLIQLEIDHILPAY